MAGLASSTSEHLEGGDDPDMTPEQRVEAARARHRRQHAIMQANQDAGFDLGEDAPQNAAGRQVQEAKWAAANVDARVHFSVRELLRVQRPAVRNALDDYQRIVTLVNAIGDESAEADASSAPPHQFARLTPELLQLVVGAAMPGQGPLVPAMLSPALRTPPVRPLSLGTFRIFVRVRPLLSGEASGGEYSALATPSPRQLVCHDARLARSGRRLSVVHHWYFADDVFGEKAKDEKVCGGVIEPLLQRVVSGAGDATALLYGQTGAGKTYTLSSLLEHVASHLDSAAASSAAGGTSVEVTFFEVASKGCMDLLNERAKVALRSDENDVVHACGATTSVVTSGEELRTTLAQGLQMRSTVETQANPISSRSHAICVLHFTGKTGGEATGEATSTPRTLRIVDLAGSERNYETLYEKSREFQRDTSAINKSLMALKDCFRESARLRELRARKERGEKSGSGKGGSGSGGVYAAARAATRGDTSAAAGMVRMRASREEADGAAQHIDLTPKSAIDARWTSSWRKGLVNGKPIPKDANPAIKPPQQPQPPQPHSPPSRRTSGGGGGGNGSTPIEISDMRTGALLYAGEIQGAESRPEAEEAAALAAAIEESLKTTPNASAKKEEAEEEKEAEDATTKEAKKAPDEGATAAPSGGDEEGPTATAEPPTAATATGDAPPPATAAPPAAPTGPSVRVPYRASMLTRVLRNCFEDDSHRTAIVAAVAPGAESVIHTLNTLDHVVLMAPHLRHASCEVDVPMIGAASSEGGGGHSYEGTPVHEWTAEQVVEWLATAEGGRFSQVVVPRGTEGKDLLRLNARRLTDLVETENTEGREDGAGWYVSQQAKVGRALFAALRDAQRHGGIRKYS